MSYTIKEVCNQFGLTAHTLRYYEKEGILTGIERTEGGIRSYSDEDMETIGLICCLKNTGMPLAEIAQFIRLTGEGDHTLKERCDILIAHEQHVQEQMAEMEKHLEKIRWKINYFSGLLAEYEKNGSHC